MSPLISLILLILATVTNACSYPSCSKFKAPGNCNPAGSGYAQGSCNSGYVDITNNAMMNWACGVDCPGKVHGTDAGCNCACVQDTPCVPTTTTTTLEPRDCNVLDIDDFLNQCSQDYQALLTTDDLYNDEFIEISKDIEALQASIDNLDTSNTITSINTAITDLQTTTDNMNARIDLFAAQAVQGEVLLGDNASKGFGLQLKDIIVIGLLITNMIFMFFAYCYSKCANYNNNNQTKKYAVQFDESDAEQANLIKI
eukprot:149061_1